MAGEATPTLAHSSQITLSPDEVSELNDVFVDDGAEQTTEGTQPAAQQDTEDAPGRTTTTKPQGTPESQEGDKVAQKPSEDAQEGDSEGDEPPPEMVKVGDDEYPREQIEKALDSDKKRHDWSKATTEKEQQISATRKAMQPLLDLAEKVRGDSEAQEEFRDWLVERVGEEDGKKLFKSLMEFDETQYPHPETVKRQEAERERDELKEDKRIAEELNTFLGEKDLGKRDTERFFEILNEHFDRTGSDLDYDTAYGLLEGEKARKEAAKLKEQAKKPPPASLQGAQGARDIKAAKSDAAKPVDEMSDAELAEWNFQE